jgi:hypothetical protein
VTNTIERLTEARARAALPGLIALLQETVAGGAAMGFLPPVSEAEAREYWEGVLAELDTPRRILLAARANGRIPYFAYSADGSLHTTVVFYRWLGPNG